MTEDFEFFVDPIAHGRVTPRALLATTGTVMAPFIPEFLSKKQHVAITRLSGAGWFFNIGYTAGRFVVQRNGGQVSVNSRWCRGKKLPASVLVSWTLDALIISFGNHNTYGHYPQRTQQCPIVAAPPELIRWVRRHELTAVEAFQDEEQFVVRVHSSLQRFDERLRPILSRDVFWDVERVRNRVVRRKPKRETDVQAAIHAMLVDHMQLSNIDIFPELRSSSGNVDFLFCAPLKSGAVGKICVEFKNAHSARLITGLSEQLRGYMRRLEVANGAYCILDYKGHDFDLPTASTADILAALYAADEEPSRWPNRPVKIHWFKLNNPTRAVGC
jgi:hypothetical protein